MAKLTRENVESQLREYSRQWWLAHWRGDEKAKAQAHEKAEALRRRAAQAGLQVNQGGYTAEQLGLKPPAQPPTQPPARPTAPVPSAASVLGTIRAARPQPQPVFNPAFQPGWTIDLSPLFRVIGSAPRQVNVPQPTTPRAFALEHLRNLLDQPQRFQTPEHLANLVQTTSRALQPLVQTQQEAAQRAFRQALQDLQSQWAARGLVASGAAAAQERQAAEDLARQMAEIQAQAQAQAIPLALQFGQMGAAERQAAIDNLLRAIAQQEAMRQFEQTFGLDVERLRSAEQQSYLDNLARALGLAAQQQQWAQQFGLERQAQDFARWLQTQQLNQQALADWLRNLVTAGRYAATEAAEQAELAERQRQFDLTRPLQVAALTGVYEGSPTLEARRLEEQAALDRARLALEERRLAEQAALDRARLALERAAAARQATITPAQQLAALVDLARAAGEITPEMAEGFSKLTGVSLQPRTFGTRETEQALALQLMERIKKLEDMTHDEAVKEAENLERDIQFLEDIRQLSPETAKVLREQTRASIPPEQPTLLERLGQWFRARTYPGWQYIPRALSPMP